MRLTVNIFCSLVFLCFCGCDKKPPNKSEKVSIKQKRSPVEVAVIRDGETTMITVHDVPHGEISEVCFVNVSDPKIGGDLYSSVAWRSTNEKPLSILDAEKALNSIESSLRNYYGDLEIEKIITDGERLNNSPEEMIKYMNDPMLSDRLDAYFSLQLVKEFRSYYKSRSNDSFGNPK